MRPYKDDPRAPKLYEPVSAKVALGFTVTWMFGGTLLMLWLAGAFV